MKILIPLLFLLICCPAVNANLAEDLKKGDELYLKRDNPENAYQALALYEKHLDHNSENPQALWRASMGNYYVGHLLDKSSKRITHYKKGVDQGKDCIKQESGNIVECYFWLATNTALLNKEHGILSMAFGIGHMIKLFEKALELDPLYASSGPYRMLALLHYKAPGFLGGDVKKAYRYIKKAIETSPNEPLNIYFYMKFLIEDDQKQEALDLAKGFVKKADPTKFAFFESRNAFRRINHFIEKGEFPPKEQD